MRKLSFISDVMSSPVKVVGPIDALSHARNLMLRDGINRLVVVDGERKPIGILTRGDIAREASKRTQDAFDRLLVRDVMTKSLLTLKPSDNILDAAKTMLGKGISGVPIVNDDGSLAGILSKTDIVRYYVENSSNHVRISDMETHNVTTILASYTLYKAEELMRKNKIGRLVIVEGAKPVGIITQRDLSFAQFSSNDPQNKFRRTHALGEGEQMGKIRKAEGATVGEVMSSPPVTIRGDDEVEKAARLMIERGIGGIPVIDSESNLDGIITKTDILRALIIRNTKAAGSKKRR